MSRWLCVLLLALLGCRHGAPGSALPLVSYEDLPDEPAVLLELSDALAAHGPGGPDLLRSLAAAEKVLSREPTHGDAAWRAARALYFLTVDRPDLDAASLSARGMGLGEGAVDLSERAEAPFYFALCMGARAQARRAEGLGLVAKMIVAAKEAARRDPKVAHGGPDRLLGGLYLRAPAWPLSAGDLELALEHLERALGLDPTWPENYLLYAEALLEDDREEEAATALAEAKARLAAGDYTGWREPWRADLERLERQLSGPAR